MSRPFVVTLRAVLEEKKTQYRIATTSLHTSIESRVRNQSDRSQLIVVSSSSGSRHRGNPMSALAPIRRIRRAAIGSRTRPLGSLHAVGFGRPGAQGPKLPLRTHACSCTPHPGFAGPHKPCKLDCACSPARATTILVEHERSMSW
jgi:hypothetical protein